MPFLSSRLRSLRSRLLRPRSLRFRVSMSRRRPTCARPYHADAGPAVRDDLALQLGDEIRDELFTIGEHTWVFVVVVQHVDEPRRIEQARRHQPVVRQLTADVAIACSEGFAECGVIATRITKQAADIDEWRSSRRGLPVDHA